jgi:hypothetical protein|tara:strand:- start:2014 stop:2601 length:588 start_codon:yes stop_codon:yes gene_type:complete
MFDFLKKNKNKVEAKSQHDLREIYTSKDGSRWFEFANPMNTPAKRAIAAEVATRFVNMNLTKDELQKLIAKMKESANKGDIVGLFNLLAEIEFRLDFIGEEKTLLELAATYYVLEGEDADNLSESWTEKKKKILAEDSDARSFFLSKVYLFTTKSSELSGADFRRYLKKNKEHAERISRFLSANTSADTLKTSTF